jgi:multidrug resistance efflux pump
MEPEKEEMTIKKDKNVEPVSLISNSTRKRNQKWLIVILVFGILAGSFYGIRWLHYYFTHASTDDASVEGDLISVSSTVSGKIRQLPIREGEQVKKGQLIAQLREEDYQAQVDVADGVVQSINASLNEAMADVLLVKEKTEKDVQRARRSCLHLRPDLKKLKQICSWRHWILSGSVSYTKAKRFQRVKWIRYRQLIRWLKPGWKRRRKKLMKTGPSLTLLEPIPAKSP